MTPELLFVLVALTAARVTRIITADVVLDRPREWIKMHSTVRISYFFTCPWCVGFYVAGAVVFIVDYMVALPLPVLWWLAASCVVGMIGSKFDG